MAGTETRVHVARSLAAVAPAAQQVRDFAATHLDPVLAGDVELAVVETLTNAIKHGQVHNRDTADILITLRRDDRDVVVDIFDQAPLIPHGAFDSIDAETLDIDPDNLDTLMENGRGLALILLSMDEVSLHADKDIFRLHMRKRIP